MYACPHTPRPEVGCRHLLDATPEAQEFRLRFRGSSFQPLCLACVEVPDPGSFAELCRACHLGFLDRAFDGLRGAVGAPTARDRAEGLDFVRETVDVRRTIGDRIRAIAPVPRTARSRWVLWTERGMLMMIDLLANERLVSAGPFEVAPGDPTVTLRVSDDGRWAALLAERTPLGLVVDLERGGITMRLSRGDYHVEHCGWPFAFVTRSHETVAVHATEWNRLDATELGSGRRRTGAAGEDPEADSLDYFQAGLEVSANGRWIASSGWVWHPVGVTRVFDLARWLDVDPTEAHRGESVRMLWNHPDAWDGPMCWLDDRRLLVWGVGHEDGGPGVDAGLVFDFPEGRVCGWVPGLEEADLIPDPATGRFISLQANETSLWDARNGDRILRMPGFRAVGFHPGARHLLSLEDPDGSFGLGFVFRSRG